MTATKAYERIPMTFSLREFAFGQPARGMGMPEPVAKLELVPAIPAKNHWFDMKAAA